MKTFNKTNTNVGDIVYFVEYWTDHVTKARVTEVSDGGVYFNCISVVDKDGQDIQRSIGSAGALWDGLFQTAKDAYDTRDKKHDAQIKAYCEEIQTIEDLVRFPLEHCLIGDEYTDWDAYYAYKQRAQELGVLSKEQAMSL